MRSDFRLPALIASAIALALATTANATEIKILNANALTIAMKEIAADFTKETGHQVTFVGVSPGQVDQRVKAGENYDILINAIASVEAYEKEGRLRAGTRRPFARVGIGFAVREGARVDLSTVTSTRDELLGARAITYSDASTGGLSGINAKKVLENLGIAEAVKAKTKIAPNGQELISQGEVAIGLYNLSEIPRAPKVVRAGPVPAAVQVYINYDAAVPTTSTAPEPALALLKYFAHPATRAVWDKAGLEVMGE